ncbi:MAG: DUF3039 domain-containing protein [Acidimicrobiaceae bacterium]|nr:DUF3039 domain-containing protein [Acidimicrobiia bacterium]MCY4494930.1 DUF3039 domain-containing protein [Acidimicrobiaceae bacterium]
MPDTASTPTITPTATPTTTPTITPTEETVTRPVTNDGDHDRFSHYARKQDVTRAAVEGTPVVAICGKVWVPSRDPEKYPICKTCAEIKAALDARKSN